MTQIPSIEQIIERQVRLWELQRRLAEEGGETARKNLAHLGEGPWISISRQWGAGGVELARRLAEELDWQVFGKEILSEIATNTQTLETVMENLDERAIGGFNDYLTTLLIQGEPGQAAYLQEMVRVIWGIARQGKAIILGRGANWFLDQIYGLRLRVVAPQQMREAQIAERENLELAEAQRMVRDQDIRQQAFILQVFGRNTDDPLGYDLVLNMGGIDQDSAVHVVLKALQEKLGTDND